MLTPSISPDLPNHDDLDLRLAQHPDDLSDFAAWVRRHLKSPVAVDTETTGLNWWEPNFTRLVQFGSADGSGWAVPAEWYPRAIEWAMQCLKSAETPVIFHNSPFDMHALSGSGYTVPDWHNIHDTMVLHHLIAPNDRHGLKWVAAEAFGKWALDGEYYLKQAAKARKVDWWLMPIDHPLYWGYGVVDTILTARLFDKLYQDTPAYSREIEYQRVMFNAETRGLRIDTSYAVDLQRTWTTKIDNLCLNLQSAGIEKPGSNKQVELALRDMGWEPDLLTETGQAQLDKIVLGELQARGGLMSEVASQLVEYKRLRKWTSTYLTPFIQSNGTVHPSIRTLGAKTGRSSITGPPLQTLPHTPHIRRAILPYEDSQDVWAIDYASQEYRILASQSGDPAWLAEYRTGNADPHTMVSDMLGITRDQAKTFNFAMVYGAGVKKLASGTGLSVGAVKTFLALYNNRFPGIKAFKDKLEMAGLGQVKAGVPASVTTVGGRHAVANDDQLYALTNYKIQGSGADVLKDAVCKLAKAGYDDYIMLPNHDELILSLPKDGGSVLAEDIRGIMTNEDWFDIEILAETSGPYPNWGEKYA